MNSFSPFVLSPFIPFAVEQTSPQSALDDVGVGIFGQTTFALRDRVDVTAGLRFDHESKDGDLATSFSPMIAPPTQVTASESFSNVSPQVAVSYRADDKVTIYAATTGGFKAGGFNPASPPGSESLRRRAHLERGGRCRRRRWPAAGWP